MGVLTGVRRVRTPQRGVLNEVSQKTWCNWSPLADFAERWQTSHNVGVLTSAPPHHHHQKRCVEWLRFDPEHGVVVRQRTCMPPVCMRTSCRIGSCWRCCCLLRFCPAWCASSSSLLLLLLRRCCSCTATSAQPHHTCPFMMGNTALRIRDRRQHSSVLRMACLAAVCSYLCCYVETVDHTSVQHVSGDHRPPTSTPKQSVPECYGSSAVVGEFVFLSLSLEVWRTWVPSPNNQLLTPAKNDDMDALECELEQGHDRENPVLQLLLLLLIRMQHMPCPAESTKQVRCYGCSLAA